MALQSIVRCNVCGALAPAALDTDSEATESAKAAGWAVAVKLPNAKWAVDLCPDDRKKHDNLGGGR